MPCGRGRKTDSNSRLHQQSRAAPANSTSTHCPLSHSSSPSLPLQQHREGALRVHVRTCRVQGAVKLSLQTTPSVDLYTRQAVSSVPPSAFSWLGRVPNMGIMGRPWRTFCKSKAKIVGSIRDAQAQALTHKDAVNSALRSVLLLGPRPLGLQGWKPLCEGTARIPRGAAKVKQNVNPTYKN